MNILLVSYHYFPDTVVGALRASLVAAALAAAGHEVRVITARKPGQVKAVAGDDPASVVHTVRRLPHAGEVTSAVRRLLSRKHTSLRSALPRGASQAPPRWKRLLIAAALLPDEHRGFVLPALAKALRLMLGGVDLVYTSGPPHSTHLVGLLLSRATGVRWIAEFRDPWIDNAIPPRSRESRTLYAIETWLERSCLAAADGIVTVSDSAARLLARKVRKTSPLIVVRNGVPAMPVSGPIPGTPKPRLVYLGSLYHDRDPRPLLRALAVLRDRNADEVGEWEVAFYGHCRRFKGGVMSDLIADLGLEDVVHVHDDVSREAAHSIMMRGDLLLLLAQNQPAQVPAKLYEYLAAHRPILAFADAAGETSSMLRRAGGHHIIDESMGPEAIQATLLRALRSARDTFRTDESPLEKWSTANQMRALVALVESGRRALADS